MDKQVAFRLSDETIKILNNIQKDMDIRSKSEVINIIIRNYYSNKQLKLDISEIKQRLGG